MCLAAPSRVIEVADGCAIVEAFGQRRSVSLVLLEPGSVHVGDYVLVQAGGFAYERMSANDADEALRSILDLMQGNEPDQRTWGDVA